MFQPLPPPSVPFPSFDTTPLVVFPSNQPSGPMGPMGPAGPVVPGMKKNARKYNSNFMLYYQDQVNHHAVVAHYVLMLDLIFFNK